MSAPVEITDLMVETHSVARCNITVYLPINRRAVGRLCIVIYSLKYEELESWSKVCSYLTSGGAYEMCDALLNYVWLAHSQNYVEKNMYH